jgi:hypothetical protein
MPSLEIYELSLFTKFDDNATAGKSKRKKQEHALPIATFAPLT